MNLVQWGCFSKAQQDEHDQQRDARNADYIRQQVKLPSGATYTVCKAASAAASEPEPE